MTPNNAPSAALLSIALVLGQVAIAQNTLEFDGSIPVERDGTMLSMPWTGGINYAQFSAIDLDLDGRKDLFYFDRSGNTVTTLLSTSASGTSGYRHTKEFDSTWPFYELHDWVLLRDYNCDGKEDIFSYSQAGFSVYRNISNATQLEFELVEFRVECDYVFTDGSSQRTNLYVSSEDLPGFVDVDGDGDLDVLTFSQLGSFVQYYKNLSLETYGTCDSLAFELRNACWGRFAESASTNAITLNAPCPFQIPSPELQGENQADVLGPEEGERAAHAGSTVTPLDLNGDGVMDLLLGDISFNNLVALTNGGEVDDSFMIAYDPAFPSNDVGVDLPIFPAAFHLDMDKDGNRDLLVCPNSRSLAQNFKGVWYYRNNGTDASPVFEKQQEDLFQDRMLDLGEGAYPIPFDHNRDGLMDLVIANEGYFAPDGIGNKISAMTLLENIGSPSAPAFRVISTDYMGLSMSGIGESMYPAFADLDGDGDQDMYVGDLLGNMHFYRNTSTDLIAQFTLITPNVTNADGAVIDVGRHATPQFTDLDGDGLVDLISGEQNGNVNYYRNTGTSAAPEWTFVTDSLGGIRTNDIFTLGHSVPFVFMNADGEREILVGSEGGTLWHFTGIDGDLEGEWTLADSSFLDIDEGFRSSLCMHDFTGDGALDLVVGNYRGGLSFWRSDPISGINSRATTLPEPRIRPNPTAGEVEFFLEEAPATGSFWLIRNAVGQVIERVASTGTRTSVSLSYLPAGMYTVRLEGSMTSQAERLLIIAP